MAVPASDVSGALSYHMSCTSTLPANNIISSMAELANNKLEPDNHLLLEQPLLRLPHELLKRNLKTAQRHIESTNKAITASLNPSGKSYADNLAAIDATLVKAQSLKRRLEALAAEERTIHAAQHNRIRHLHDLHEIKEFTEVKYNYWSRIRLNRLLIDYLLRQGYSETAEALAKDKDVEQLVDIAVFKELRQIAAALQKGELKDALTWCGENKNSLKKINNDLEMELRLQQFIEMRRSGQPGKELEAIAYARKHFSGEQSSKYALCASGLMVFPPDTFIPPYRELYAHERWNELAEKFVDTMQTILALPASPLLHIALSAGLSALKTPSCHSAHALSNTANTGASVCPICSTELNELARNVPYAHQTKSFIEDDPVVLPNGRVYGRDRLRLLNEKLGTRRGYVRDPTELETGTEWEQTEVKKVFIS